MTDQVAIFSLSTVIAGRQLHAELHAEIVCRQKALVAGQYLGIADACDMGAADRLGALGRRVGLQLRAVGFVIAQHVRHHEGHAPIRIETVGRGEIDIAVDGALFDFAAAE